MVPRYQDMVETYLGFSSENKAVTKTFKPVLREQLCDILEEENDFIETPMIIKKVGITAKVSR